MLRTLPESHRRSHRSPRGLTVSVVLHSAVIGAAVFGTARATVVPDEPPTETIDYYVAPPKRPTPPPMPAAPRPADAAPRPDAMPAPPSAPVLDVPLTIPDVLPPPGTAVVDADAFANGLRTRAEGTGDAPTGAGLPATGDVWAPNLVEREVLPLGGSAPRYPEALRSAGVEGTVVAEFVVDTTGRVEPSRVTIVESAHPLFEGAVRQALRGMRYRPAEVGGRKVRQLVRQPFTFAITR